MLPDHPPHAISWSRAHGSRARVTVVARVPPANTRRAAGLSTLIQNRLETRAVDILLSVPPDQTLPRCVIPDLDINRVNRPGEL